MSETLAEKVVAFIDETNREAVEAERQRYTESLRKARDKILFAGKPSSAVAALDVCLDAIYSPTSEPPPPKPMTIPKLIATLRKHVVLTRDWSELEADLALLVQAQARRDAAICDDISTRAKRAGSGGRDRGAADCRDDILESAGLK